MISLRIDTLSTSIQLYLPMNCDRTFEPIFINIAKYLGMNYLGCYFYYAGDNENILVTNPVLANEFINQLNKNPAITENEMTGS
jgi:hypothetical protein